MTAPGWAQGSIGGISGGFSMSSHSDGKTAEITFGPAPSPMPVNVVTGAPYSGTQTNRIVKTLADGTHIARSGMLSITTYHDSMGRTRTEREAFPSPPGGKTALTFTIAQIADPVSGDYYVLDSINKVAHRTPLKVINAGAPRIFTPASGPSHTMPDGATVTVESLGLQVMFGVTVNGTKTTTVHPAGSRMGNDKPVTSVSESWSSPQLGLTLLSKSTSPEGSESTTMIENFSAYEPAASLFQAPPGYAVVNEAGAFTIRISKAAK